MKRYIYASKSINDIDQFTNIFVDQFISTFDLDLGDITNITSGSFWFPNRRIAIANHKLKAIEIQFLPADRFARGKKVSTMQGGFDDWLVRVLDSDPDPYAAVADLARKSSFLKWLSPAVSDKWPSSRKWESLDLRSEAFEDMWNQWLASAESEVDKQLQIFTEPSIQGGYGSMFVFDESNQDRFESISVDFGDWCETEMYLAAQSRNEAEYKKKYEAWMKKLCNI